MLGNTYKYKEMPTKKRDCYWDRTHKSRFYSHTLCPCTHWPETFIIIKLFGSIFLIVLTNTPKRGVTLSKDPFKLVKVELKV